MARKQVTIQDTVETNEELEEYLIAHANQLICMEVYSEFCGYCLATGNAIRKGKLEIGQDRIAMVKAQCDNIDLLERFRGKSEPAFLFIMKGKLTRATFGANGIELVRLIEEQLGMMKMEAEGGNTVPKYDIEVCLPEEIEKMEETMRIEKELFEAAERLRTLTLAARKKRVSERLAKHLTKYNFIMFWPHCHHAHYDLYEKWDEISLNVAAREEIQLTEEMAREALYMSDIDINEACMHSLLSGPALVVLFKFFETDDRNIIDVMRYALYEEIPIPKEGLPEEKQLKPIPAYERYAMISKTAREVRRERHNAKLAKLQQEKEERERLEQEQARIARQAEEEKLAEEQKRKDEERMARIQAGLPAEEEMPAGEGEAVEGLEGEEKPEGAEPTEGTEGTTTVTTVTSTTAGTEEVAAGEVNPELVEAEEFHSDVEVEGEEYIPPGGLFIPGLYSPANELAKANGIKLFFPKVVLSVGGQLESEILPPHIAVMFNIEKRHEVSEIIRQFPGEILNVGIFVGDDPFKAEHVAYSIKQYDKMSRHVRYKDRIALMVSRKRSLPMLQLAGLNPCYISSDVSAGERDCLTLFPVGYADDFEEEESVVEEEHVEEVHIAEAVPSEAMQEKVEEEEDEDMDI